jgi:hypothetical protein
MVATAAANEVMALERGDDEAVRFHTELLNQCLELAEVPASPWRYPATNANARITSAGVMGLLS